MIVLGRSKTNRYQESWLCRREDNRCLLLFQVRWQHELTDDGDRLEEKLEWEILFVISQVRPHTALWTSAHFYSRWKNAAKRKPYGFVVVANHISLKVYCWQHATSSCHKPYVPTADEQEIAGLNAIGSLYLPCKSMAFLAGGLILSWSWRKESRFILQSNSQTWIRSYDLFSPAS